MKRFLANAFSINMLPSGGASVVFTPIEDMGSVQALLDEPLLENCIGHKDLLAIVKADFPNVPDPHEERPTVLLRAGDELVVAQYRGPRLPEGTTELPEGAKIEWWYVHVG